MQLNQIPPKIIPSEQYASKQIVDKNTLKSNLVYWTQPSLILHATNLLLKMTAQRMRAKVVYEY